MVVERLWVGTLQRFVVGVLLCIFCAGGALAQQPFMAGASVRNITPDPLLPVSGGIGTPKKAQEKKGDLFVRVMVLKKGDEKLAIVGIDNLGWPSALGDLSRALAPRIPAENILIGATHTHSGPDAYGFPNEQGQHFADLTYLNHCVQQIAEAINEAYDSLRPATLKIATGEAKGKIAFNYYAEDLYDPRAGIIQAIDIGNQQVIGTLVNYAIHPEVLGSDRGLLSPDVCGPLYDRIEQKFGGVAVFMNGALGGMVTADNRPENSQKSQAVDNETMWQEAVRIGELLADESIRILEEKGEVVTNPDLTVLSKKVDFPVESPIMQYILSNSPIGYSGSKEGHVTTQVNVVKIGPAKILTIPGEALPNIGYYLKRKMNTPHAFLFGLTNDAFGYMLTKVDYNSFKRYEYITRTSLGELTGELFIEEALSLLDQLHH